MSPAAREYSLWVPGVPVTWKRVGTGRTAEPDSRWRNLVRYEWVKQIGCLNFYGPVRMLVVVVTPHQSDTDNATKGILDCLQGETYWRPSGDWQTPIYWNDKQVWQLTSIVVPAPSRCDAGAFIWVALDEGSSRWPSSRRSQ